MFVVSFAAAWSRPSTTTVKTMHFAATSLHKPMTTIAASDKCNIACRLVIFSPEEAGSQNSFFPLHEDRPRQANVRLSERSREGQLRVTRSSLGLGSSTQHPQEGKHRVQSRLCVLSDPRDSHGRTPWSLPASLRFKTNVALSKALSNFPAFLPAHEGPLQSDLSLSLTFCTA